jgi:hypothetical protein
MVASIALEYFPGIDFTVGVIATHRADKPIRPTESEQYFPAFALRAIPIHEIMKTQTSLKLNFVLSHADTSFSQGVKLNTYKISMAEKKW